MIFLIGGAPRSGKSTLGQLIAAQERIGWIGTDLLIELLRVAHDPGAPRQWDAAPEAIRATAEWFSPFLDRFLWGLSSQADHYLIEGVHFLPGHAVALAQKYAIRSVFLGCSRMSLARLDAYPGRSPGYAHLPTTLRLQIAADVPAWSALLERECERWGAPYLDLVDDFADGQRRIRQALGLDPGRRDQTDG